MTHKLWSNTLLAISLVLLPVCSWGQFFEYEHLGDEEQRELNSPRLIDSEYSSDKLAYQLPLVWNYQFISQDKVFQYGAGSLGPTRFLTRGRFKLRQNLSERFFFQLSWLELGDFEQDRRHALFEFGYRLRSDLSLHIYGEPATLKREDDIGLALEWAPSLRQRLRLFHTWVDFSHNKRNEAADLYSQTPSSWGFVWRSWQAPERGEAYMELGYRHDGETLRTDPISGELYRFSGEHLRWSQRTLVKHAGVLQWDIDARRGFEGSQRFADGSVNLWRSDRLESLIQWEAPYPWLSIVGLQLVHLDWQSEQGPVRHNRLLPHLWLNVYETQASGQWQQSIQVGFETTWHRGRGDPSLRGIRDFNDIWESRTNVRYRVFAQDQGEFNLLLSFDLDSFGKEPWEGGSMQYSMFF